eukprot:15329801-Ditylum_brightwellii.AAC.1
MLPKDNQLKYHHLTKSGKQPVTYCTVCKSWHYDHDGGHFAKDHTTWKKSKEGAKKNSDTNKCNRNRNKNKATPTATVTIQEDEDEDQTSDQEEDDNATTGFTTIFNNNWI